MLENQDWCGVYSDVEWVVQWVSIWRREVARERAPPSSPAPLCTQQQDTLVEVPDIGLLAVAAHRPPEVCAEREREREGTVNAHAGGAHQLESASFTARGVGDESGREKSETVEGQEEEGGAAAHCGIIVSDYWLGIYAVQHHLRGLAGENCIFAGFPWLPPVNA